MAAVRTTIDSNISALAWNMNIKSKALKPAIGDGLDEAAKMGVQQEKALLTPHSKTGGLMGSVQWFPEGNWGRIFGPTKTGAQPMAIEFGRKSFCAKGLREGAPNKGDFFSKTSGAINIAHALRFEYKGKMIFTRCVGPAKAQPYVRPTRTSMKVLFPRIMQTRVRAALSL